MTSAPRPGAVLSPYHQPGFYDQALAQGRHRAIVGGRWDETGRLQMQRLRAAGPDRHDHRDHRADAEDHRESQRRRTTLTPQDEGLTARRCFPKHDPDLGSG